jgi:allophanate hydrolase
MPMKEQSFAIEDLLSGYRDGAFTPGQVIDEALRRAEQGQSHNTWIRRLSREALALYLDRLASASPDTLPLYGIPFAIKDNIDLAGVPTTAACPDYAYVPERSATVVERLIEAGAIPLGKTNLDQFATGLVGARSPYGPGRNAFNPAYISGGSSSGSAISVARGEVSFSLGTDTAGSGRVPAAFNNLVGLKPTRGLLSTRGVVPACRSLDCVSIFALSAAEADAVQQVAAGFDAEDPWSRRRGKGPAVPDSSFRFGVPRSDQLAFFGNREAQRLFGESVSRMEALGGHRVEIDFLPFLDCARLLYEGPWVAERYAAIASFIERQPESLLPVTRTIIGGGSRPSAVEAFEGQYRLAELRRTAEGEMARVDVILTPTAGTIYRVDEVEADPVALNANLGYYTNFMNLLDMAAVAVPAGFQADGLPFGVTLCGPAFAESLLLELGDRFHRCGQLTAGATERPLPLATVSSHGGESVRIAVCGAHMSGLPLNHQLTDRGGRLVTGARTAPNYRLFVLPGDPPARPGLVRTEEGGAIAVEIWDLPVERFGDFVEQIPAPLGIGKVELAHGAVVSGFLCESYAVEGAREITHLGGWRAYLTARR